MNGLAMKMICIPRKCLLFIRSLFQVKHRDLVRKAITQTNTNMFYIQRGAGAGGGGEEGRVTISTQHGHGETEDTRAGLRSPEYHLVSQGPMSFLSTKEDCLNTAMNKAFVSMCGTAGWTGAAPAPPHPKHSLRQPAVRQRPHWHLLPPITKTLQDLLSFKLYQHTGQHFHLQAVQLPINKFSM